MKRYLNLILGTLFAFCFFGCITAPEEGQNGKIYDVDLTDSLTDTWLMPNIWGEEKSKYQDSGFNVSAKLNEHPRKGDTLNLTWKGKSETDIKNLYMMIADVEFFDDGHTNWTSIATDEEKFQLVASNVKAGENLELKSSFTLNADSDHALQLHFCCGEDDTSESVHLYSDNFVLPNPDIILKRKTLGTLLDKAAVNDNVITWSKGNNFEQCGWDLSDVNLSEYDRVRVELESTEAPIYISLYDKDWQNCHSFFTPVEENVWEIDLSGAGAEWMVENGTAFDKSKGLKIAIVSSINEGKVRETDQTTVVKKVELLKGRKNENLILENTLFGSHFWNAVVHDEGIIEWLWDGEDRYPGAGWNMKNIDLSAYQKLRIEIDYTDTPIGITLVQDSWNASLNYYDIPVSQNVIEINLDGTGYDEKWPVDCQWDSSKKIDAIVIRAVELTENGKKTKIKSASLIK